MKKNYPISLVSILAIALFYLWSLHHYERWSDNIISGGDSWGYYMYLPALFIHGDLAKLDTSTKIRITYNKGYGPQAGNQDIKEALKHPNNNRVIKYTSGLAILYSPFFFIAHAIALNSSYPADGYSFIYIYVMHLSALFYVLLGLLILRKMLLQWTDDIVVSLTLMVIAVATNLYFFSVYNATMSHAYLFALYAFLIYFTDQWYRKGYRFSAILTGITAGFITLIRPTEFICILIPLLWGFGTSRNLTKQFIYFKKHYKGLLLSISAFIVMGLPQIIYWKIMTGSYLFYSYGEEGFNFANPEIWRGLFGFKNGWLAYTPVMLFALIGILIAAKKKHPSLWPILTFLSIHIYITYSWWCWYYIAGFGSRPMVEAYPLLSIPLALLIQQLRKTTRWLQIPSLVLLGAFIFLNLSQTQQIFNGVLYSSLGNWPYYKRIVGKQKLNLLDMAAFDTGLHQPDESKLTFVKTLRVNNYDDSTSIHFVKKDNRDSGFVFLLNNKTQYAPSIKIPIKEIENIQAGDWLKVSVDAMKPEVHSSVYRMSKLVVVIEPKKLWAALRLDNKLGNNVSSIRSGETNVWSTPYLWIQIPPGLQKSDLLKCYVWNSNAKDIYIDNLKIELWKE